jgi:hypothetical protein
VVPPTDVVRAHEMLEDRAHTGKIVLDLAGNPLGGS